MGWLAGEQCKDQQLQIAGRELAAGPEAAGRGKAASEASVPTASASIRPILITHGTSFIYDTAENISLDILRFAGGQDENVLHAW
jgi:hypothetical protein